MLELLGMGVESLERLTVITEDETEWREFKAALSSRVGNVNVVSALILACVFVLGSTADGLVNNSNNLAFVVALQRS